MKYLFIISVILILQYPAIYGQNTYSKFISFCNGKSIVEYNQFFFISGSVPLLSALDEDYNGIEIVKTDFEGNLLISVRIEDGDSLNIIPGDYFLGNYGSMKIVNDSIFLPVAYKNYYTDIFEQRVSLFNLNAELIQSFIYPFDNISLISDIAINPSGIYSVGKYSDMMGLTSMTLRKTDYQGNIIFDELFNGNNPSLPIVSDGYNIEQDGTGFILGGSTTYDGITNGYILKIDEFGQIIWDLEINNPYNDQNNYNASNVNILPIFTGGYVYTISFEQIGGLANYNDTYVVKIDENLQPEWSYIVGEGEESIKMIHNIKVLEDGSIIGCGLSNNNPALGGDAAMGWLFKLSATGEKLWERNYYYAPNAYPISNETLYLNDLIQASDGSIVAVGVYQYVYYFPLVNRLWLLKLDENGCLTPGCTEELTIVGIEDSFPDDGMLDVVEKFFTLSPNPTTDLSTASFYNPISRNASVLSISSLSGQEIQRVVLERGQRDIKLSLGDFSTGIYLVSYMSEGRILQSEKLVVE